MIHSLLNHLMQALPAASDLSTIPSVRPQRHRMSQFQPFREEILRSHSQGKSLTAILASLKRRYSDTPIPSSKSQLSRFIARCYRTQ